MSKSRFYCPKFIEYKSGSGIMEQTSAGKRFAKKIVRRHARQKGKQYISKEIIREMQADYEEQFTCIRYSMYPCECVQCIAERDRDLWDLFDSDYFISSDDMIEPDDMYIGYLEEEEFYYSPKTSFALQSRFTDDWTADNYKFITVREFLKPLDGAYKFSYEIWNSWTSEIQDEVFDYLNLKDRAARYSPAVLAPYLYS